MAQMADITAREWIDLIDSLVIGKNENDKIFFFWSPPYATIGLSANDYRHPIDHITVSEWSGMDDDFKYGFVNAIDRAGLRMFDRAIYL